MDSDAENAETAIRRAVPGRLPPPPLVTACLTRRLVQFETVTSWLAQRTATPYAVPTFRASSKWQSETRAKTVSASQIAA